MNEALQAILDYVQTPQTDYALLITGPWGCGKTYFWRNLVEPQLRQLQLGDEGCRPLYASLYGPESVKDIDTQLFLASHPHLKKKWATRLTSVGGSTLNQLLKALTGLELPAIDLRWLIDTKNAVLCFDDLERTRLPMKEALGYINTFVEHERAKVIILCNEEAISDEDDKNTYSTMKEKVVGTSLAFHPEIDTVFKTLVDGYQSQAQYHGFLVQNADLLRRLFEQSGTHNLRSLRRAMSALAVVVDALHSNNVNPHTVAKQLINAVAPASFELHGRGVDPAKVRGVLDADNMAIAGWVASSRKKEKPNEDSFSTKFANRYFGDIGLGEWKNAVGCPPICEFLLTGVLDRNGLAVWARDLTRPPNEEEERVKRITSDPDCMEDEEFTRTADQILKDIDTGEISDISAYISLYRIFESCIDEGLIAKIRSELLQRVLGGLAKAEELHRLKPDPRLQDHFIHMVGDLSVEGRRLLQNAIEVNKRLILAVKAEQIQILASRLEQDPQGFIDALTARGESGFLSTPVFQSLPLQQVAAKLCAVPNRIKVSFRTAIRARYSDRNPLDPFLIELPFLKQLVAHLKADCEASQTEAAIPMSQFVLRSIVQALGEAIDSLTKAEQQKASTVQPVNVEEKGGGHDDSSAEPENPA